MTDEEFESIIGLPPGYIGVLEILEMFNADVIEIITDDIGDKTTKSVRKRSCPTSSSDYR